MSKSILLAITLLIAGLLAGTHWGAYRMGQSDLAASTATAAVEAGNDNADETEQMQIINDLAVAEYHQQTIELIGERNELQAELKRLQLEKRANDAVNDHRDLPGANFNARLQLINQAGDCAGLPKANDKPLVIEDADGLERYSLEVSTEYCRVAGQLAKLIEVTR